MRSEKSSQSKISGPQDFATTQWSLVLTAGDLKQGDAHDALSTLCETYWLPLYAYVRRRVADVNEAQDLTQAFFAELLEKNYVGTADPSRGRFRAYLLTAFKHFLSKEWERGRAQKRGGGKAPLSIDFAEADISFAHQPTGELTPEQFYDRQWVVTLLEHTLQRLAKELDQAGKSRQFEVLRGYLIGDHQGLTYAQAADTLGISEAAAKQAASRLRKRYRELLREEIGQTVGSPEGIEEEIRNLFAVFEK